MKRRLFYCCVLLSISSFSWGATHGNAGTSHHQATTKAAVHNPSVSATVSTKKLTHRTAPPAHSGKRTHHAHSKHGAHQVHSVADNSRSSILVSDAEGSAVAPLENTPKYFSWAKEVGQGIVGLARRTIANLRYTNYSFGGSHYDPNRGIYILDCSDYVDNVLNQASPRAYGSLVNGTGTGKPTTADYYNFFNRLPVKAGGTVWHRVEDASQVQPGDILVFRYKNGRRGYAAGGHVMIVMNKPIRSNNVLLVQVADSAVSGHSQDTRPAHASGVGMGTLLLKVDPRTDQLAAYSWKMGAPWKDNVNFAIGRPAEA